MKSMHLLGAAATAALLAAPAMAQPQDYPPQNVTAYPDRNDGPSSAIPAEKAGRETSGVVLLSSPTPASEAWRLKAGDPTVISNAPIPDTPGNRARYGAPMSHAGKMTAPVGD